MFSNNLKYLMEITNTTNTELANAIPVSQSCISRLKNGKRDLPKTALYIPIISDFFAKKIIKNNMQNRLKDIIKTDGKNSLKFNIECWLKSDNSIPNFNKDFNPELDNNYYYGDDGKRKAVIKFLTNANKKSNQTLFLYSDESMNWMMDRDFIIEWKKLLISVLKNDNKIIIIHTIAREYSEIFEAISKWIPMYLTGLMNLIIFQN